jgi:Mrp family chromosome partitioning ATPase
MNAPVLAQRCDGVIVVVKHGETSQQDLERTLHLLRDANVVGVVINRHRNRTPGWVERALSLRS